MHLTSRKALWSDFGTMMRLCRRDGEAEQVCREEWNHLWQQGHAFGVVVHDMCCTGPEADLGIMVGVFVENEVLQALIDSEAPDVLQNLLVISQQGKKPFVLPWEIGERNAGSGLNLLVCYMGWECDPESGYPDLAVRAFVCNSFADREGGHKLKWVVGEVEGTDLVQLAVKSGCRVLNPYENWNAQNRPSHPPTLLGLDRAGALETENYWLGRLFSYFPPRFYFTEPQRQILLLAREGYTDAEIATMVGAKADAIKKRWVSIYQRVSEVFPHILPNSGAMGRGAEKRRALLAHLRDRPEELRPYARRVAEMSRG